MSVLFFSFYNGKVLFPLNNSMTTSVHFFLVWNGFAFSLTSVKFRGHSIAQLLQVFCKEHHSDASSSVTNVALIIHRNATDINSNLVWHLSFEDRLLLRHCVAKRQG
uniref:Uncharacterized protein n=1 Tax=Opuntia streptacantha TaxID=393608 RepID=A0A7C9CXA1_OPUST